MGDLIRVMVVDDSLLMQAIVGDMITEMDGVELAGVANSGEEALQKFAKLHPDIVTLDVQMPGLSGLETLKKLLELRSVPVIMVSAVTRLGAEVTQQALEIGALDFVAKPEKISSNGDEFQKLLTQKIRQLVHEDVDRVLQIRRERTLRVNRRVEQKANPEISNQDFENCCVAIGVSTGGPPALAQLFECLVPPLPSIIIVQHMPPNFTRTFSNRLNSISPLSVKEAESGDQLRPNHVFVARGGKHLHLKTIGDRNELILSDAAPVSSHKPSVDVMMKDVAQIFGNRCIGVIMTGMGSDGVEGCRLIQQAGGVVLGQDKSTSDVYGMNKMAFVKGFVDQQFKLQELPQLLTAQCHKLLKMPVTLSKEN